MILNIVDLIMGTRFAFGYYCNRNFNKLVSIVAVLYCIAVYIFFALNTIRGVVFSQFQPMLYLYLFSLFEYTLQVFLTLINEDNFYKFYASLKTIRIPGSTQQNLRVSLSLYLFLIGSKCIVSILTCICFKPSCAKIGWTGAILHCLKSAIDVYALSIVLTFELIWNKMKAIRKYFETNIKTSSMITNDETKERIKQGVLMYKSTLNIIYISHSQKFLVRKI